MIELGLVDIRGEDDVVRAHQTTRTIVAQLGFSTFEQTRIATAMSEIARNALTYAGGGSVTVGLDDARTSLTIIVLDPSQEIRRLQRDVVERDARIVELTEELAETNRGVMALHAELEARAEYQRRAGELRTRIVSEMGHELRTPLHSLATISQFLIDRLDGELNAEQDKQVRIIHQVAESLTAYVNDLLDLARTDAGKMAVRAAPAAVDALLKTLRRIMQPLAPPGVALRFVVDRYEGELPAAAQDRAAPPLVEAIPAAGRPRILVIDDDVASRYVLRRWLEGRYDIDEAESGQEGLRLAAERPAAIFLDVVMPDLTGFEVLERLKADPATRDIPVVVYTALVLGANDRERLGAAADILRKSTSSRVADRAAIEAALVRAGIAIPVEAAGV